MTTVISDRVVRRILVALDASRQSQTALEVAVRLAEWHDAEIQGIYVEDINLIRLAALGVGQEIGPTSPAPLSMDPIQLARRLSLGAATAKHILADMAERRKVRWAFRVERGDVTSVILRAAGEADIVALGRAGAGRPGPGRLGSTAQAVAAQQPRSLIVVQTPLAAGQTIVAFFDGSESCTRAVATAAALCTRLEARLVILASEQADATHEPDTSRLVADAANLVKDLAVPVRVRSVRTDRNLARTIQEEKPALCIVGCEATTGTDLVRQLADRLRVSVYLVK